MDHLELIRDTRPVSSSRRHSASSDEDTHIPTIHSRRKNSLALEKAEGGFKGASSSERGSTFRMSFSNKSRNRMWLRTVALLLAIFGLIYFFLKEDRFNIINPKILKSDGKVNICVYMYLLLCLYKYLMPMCIYIYIHLSISICYMSYLNT